LSLCAIGKHFQNRHAALFAAVCFENRFEDVPKSIDLGASRSKRRIRGRFPGKIQF
jgi:hypothetical protein